MADSGPKKERHIKRRVARKSGGLPVVCDHAVAYHLDGYPASSQHLYYGSQRADDDNIVCPIHPPEYFCVQERRRSRRGKECIV